MKLPSSGNGHLKSLHPKEAKSMSADLFGNYVESYKLNHLWSSIVRTPQSLRTSISTHFQHPSGAKTYEPNKYVAIVIPWVVERTCKWGALSLSFSRIMRDVPVLPSLHFWKAAAWSSSLLLKLSPVEWPETSSDMEPDTKWQKSLCWHPHSLLTGLSVVSALGHVDNSISATEASVLAVTPPSLWHCQIPLMNSFLE